MKLKKAIKLLKRHNKWRRGAEIEMLDPATLGKVITKIVKYYETTNQKRNRSDI